MDLRQLEYFVRIAELGSFTRASADLRVAQPALSRQIRQLEVELRASLLTRSGRGVGLTEAGAVLLEHARAVLHQLERAREEVGQVRGGLAGNVRVGLPPGVAKRLAVPLTRTFRERLPESTLSISEGLTLALQDQLLAGHLDIALLYNPVWSPELDCQLLLEEDFVLVRRRRSDADTADASITLREVATQPLVIPRRSHAIRNLVESRMATIGCRPAIACEVDGVAAILDLVADGVGAAVLSMNAVTTSGRAGLFTCQPVVEPHLRSALVIATSARRPVTRTHTAAAELIAELAADGLSRAEESPAPAARPAPPT